MGTLQVPSGGEARRAVGDALLDATANIDTSSIKSRLDAFKKVHEKYRAAQKKVQVAEAPLDARRALNGELDAAQDDAVEALVDALVKDGFPRFNPLKGFSTYAPSKLAELGYADEAEEIHKVVKKVLAKKGVSKGTVTAAKAADAAATALEAGLQKVAPLQRAYASVLTQRDALVPAWEAAFAKLKRGARFADEEGASGLFVALFGTTAKPKKKAKPAPVAAPAA
jgi:hypothetical protein